MRKLLSSLGHDVKLANREISMGFPKLKRSGDFSFSSANLGHMAAMRLGFVSGYWEEDLS